MSWVQLIADILAKETGFEAAKISDLIEIPPDPALGDFAFPCFQLAKTKKMAPNEIAQQLSKKLRGHERFSKIEAVGGYINFKVDPARFYHDVLTAILTHKEYGSSNLGHGKTVVIDFSSPNIARPLGVGHLGTTVIGAALRRIFQFLGYKTVGINYLGDWGTQFGKLIVALKRWGGAFEGAIGNLGEEPLSHQNLAPELQNTKFLLDLYVKFHEEAQSNSALEDEARLAFLQCEKGDKENLKLWRGLVEISKRELHSTYQKLGITFDSEESESMYNAEVSDVIENIRRRELLRESEGALIADLEQYDLPPILLQRKDGASLYSTRDIAAALDRAQRFHFDLMLYVVGSEQRLHFQQLFALLKDMGYPWVDCCHHVPLGLVTLDGEKMSTRAGRIVFLEDLMERALQIARSLIEEKNPTLAEKEEIARQVSIGAIIFSPLSQRRGKDVRFEWDKALAFEGETAPYLQYTHARACSILRKAGLETVSASAIDWKALGNPEEHAMIRLLDRFPAQIEIAGNQFEPYVIARFLLDLAGAFNRFYYHHRVLDPANSTLQEARLAVVSATRDVLRTGLKLLGIPHPEEI